MKNGKYYKGASNITEQQKENQNISKNNIEYTSKNRIKTEIKVGTITIKPISLIMRILTIIFILLCILNINKTISYFTDIATTTNEFTIDANYTVTFNSNNGTGTMNPQEISYNVATNLTANSYTKSGYSFKDWNTKSDGSGTTYTNGQSVTNLDDIVLYAQWNMDTYNIEYTLNDGTVASSNPTTYTVETSNFTLNNPSKTGYTFKGWSGTDLTGDTNNTVTIAKGSTGDRTYTANWTANTYYIKFDANDGSGSMSDQTMKYDTPANLTANNFTRAGYLFTGWNTKWNGNGTSYTDSQSVNNLTSTNGATFKLYAQWEAQPTKYAVQIYGINQDVDSSGNTLGLTFGPATGADYNNSYVTHEYDDNGDGTYNVMIVTHTVAANGTETTSSANLTDSTGANVTRTTAEKNKYDVNIHEMTWADIKAVSDKTVFTDCMLCGDTKSVKLTLNSTISRGSLYDQYGDGAGILYQTIDTYYQIWNPSTSKNAAATNGGSFGSNAQDAGGYSTSHIRATLIGENSDTDITYAGDVNLTSSTCLYSCIESDLQDVITAKKVKYVTGTSESSYSLNDDIADKIWLFSEREMYGKGEYSGYTTEGLGVNGDGYDKFGNTESKYYMSSYNTNNETNNRVVYNERGMIWSNLWLRSPHLVGGNNSRCVYKSGRINVNNAYVATGWSFGFCIQ